MAVQLDLFSDHPSIFQTKDSIQEAVDYIQGQLPITDSNELITLLNMFHNTVKSELKKGQSDAS